jgi:uncharacterized repeat protein (TIGR02543 family)
MDAQNKDTSVRIAGIVGLITVTLAVLSIIIRFFTDLWSNNVVSFKVLIVFSALCSIVSIVVIYVILKVFCKKWGWLVNKRKKIFDIAALAIIIAICIVSACLICANNYTLTYDASGGFGAPPMGKYEQDAIVTILSVPPVRSGYTFMGWLYNDVIYSVGSTFTMPATNVILTAQWTKNPSVIYDANGGLGTPDECQYKQDDVVTVSDVVPLMPNHDFGGWLYNGVIYTADKTFTMPDADVILEAQWHKVEHSVTYNGNGHTGGSVSADNTLYLNGSSVTVKNQGDLTKEDYDFSGWSTNSDATIITHAINSNFIIKEDTVLYAVWQPTLGYGVLIKIQVQ